MTDDRRILEMAAKACGKWPNDFELGDNNLPIFDGAKGFRLAWGAGWWNPDANPADCAEMVAELSLDTFWFDDSVTVERRDISLDENFKNHPTRLSAWMRAATRAAAAIGEAM